MGKLDREKKDDRPKRVKVKDKEMAKADVKYKQIWKCPICDEKVSFPKEAWTAWSSTQQTAYIAELERKHLVHSE